ncbi:MAG TPA: DUF192 domain-containing protein [Bryobacteraceae bacterium]|nr:DUF192 domain-containing protein [Bryobacteraceae bacterium]HOQ44942.1 DUF192 domain-containing protein [Bryobacteraceae bacterium]HPU72048.1 DUF192 domain-containing protein [Bryobacteraceae bacterium]
MVRWRLSAACFALALALAGCGPKAVTLDEYQTTIVTFPNGKSVRAEMMLRDVDLMRGMMFRDSLPPDRGMLFFHARPGKYQYWMYQVRIPLDIVWMDRTRRIVEISANTPPCTSSKASECPLYGGNFEAQYVLELAGGMAAKYGLRVGDTLRF